MQKLTGFSSRLLRLQPAGFPWIVLIPTSKVTSGFPKALAETKTKKQANIPPHNALPQVGYQFYLHPQSFISPASCVGRLKPGGRKLTCEFLPPGHIHPFLWKWGSSLSPSPLASPWQTFKIFFIPFGEFHNIHFDYILSPNSFQIISSLFT